ncbi:MAG: RNA polymerase sigma-54 factor RpoN [Rhodobacteraceae bacterium HLUCCA12]|nr:MAG: RNA polymerase sigma-54 factor RpoN [Rhodobacteraceae bacterium HLUCCA12]
MALRTRLDLRQSQRLALSQQMRTALSVLRMSQPELSEELAREAARNPFLRHRPAQAAPGPVASDDLVARETSMQVSLARQLALMTLPPQVAVAAHLLVAELRDDGILDRDIRELSGELGLEPALLDDALAALQRCEPPGVGARDLSESLVLQLVDKGLSRPDAHQTIQHLRHFIARDRAALTRLGLSPDEINHRTDLVRSLTTRPVAPASPAGDVLTSADLRVERDPGGALSVSLARQRPDAALDESLVRRAERDGFAPELLARARALVAAVQNRGQTLLTIGSWLLENQPGFFQSGPGELRPLTRAHMAGSLGLHPSTIGRAVAGKSIDVDGRLWPLSVFFSSALPVGDGAISSRQVRARILALIADETAQSPMTDAALTQKLQSEGVDIARRTVAKYRQDLRIPTASSRRRHANAQR